MAYAFAACAPSGTTGDGTTHFHASGTARMNASSTDRRLPNGTVLDNRTLFIVDSTGKIAHVMAPFREVDPSAYTELTDAVKRIAGPP